MPEETVHILGEGGTVFEIALPLHETIAERMAKGQIRRVNPDGSPYDGPSEAAVPEAPSAAPKASAAKPEWVAWAIACGMDPDEAAAATKQDLADRYGAAG